MTKPPTRKLFCSTALDTLTAARSRDYPILVDRGAPSEVVVATVAVLVRAAAERSDCGVDHLLQSAVESVAHGLKEVGNVTEQEARTAVDLLFLARPRGDGLLQETYDLAEAWALTHSFVDALAVEGVGVQLLQTIETYGPGVLNKLAHEVETLAWELHMREQFDNPIDPEEENRP